MNTLLIVVDALRVDRIGSYGGRPVTPTIDELVDDGTIFENAYSTTNATDPALTSLQTGKHPITHGVINHGSHVTDEEKRRVEDTEPLPVVLNDDGFSTGAFGRPLGRWHRRGFDRYPELTSGHWRLQSIENSISNLLYTLYPPVGDAVSGVYNKLINRTGSGDDGDLIDRFDKFVDDTDQFYSLVHLMDTHTPYDTDDDLVETYLNRYDYENELFTDVAEEFPTGSITHNSLQPGGVVNQDNESWQDHELGVGTALAQAQYDAAATEADKKISDLLSVLRERDLFEETLVIVLADHGESLGEHGIYFEHHGLYEPSVHIPLIVHPPFETTDRVSELVSIVDIAPTVLDLVNRPAFESDGQSLSPLLDQSKDNKWEQRDALLFEEANTQRFRGIRTENWKYIRAIDDPNCRYCEQPHGRVEQLYNLEKDPDELENLVDERAKQVSKLRNQLDQLISQYNPQNKPRNLNDGTVTYDDEDEVLDRLEDLGYR